MKKKEPICIIIKTLSPPKKALTIAFNFTKEALSQKELITHIFFLENAVDIVNFDNDLHKEWLFLHQNFSIELLICSGALAKRSLVLPSDNTTHTNKKKVFTSSSLGHLSTLLSTHRSIVFS